MKQFILGFVALFAGITSTFGQSTKIAYVNTQVIIDTLPAKDTCTQERMDSLSVKTNPQFSLRYGYEFHWLLFAYNSHLARQGITLLGYLSITSFSIEYPKQ